MTPVETLILVLYFFVLSILAIYGWHRYYLVYLYTKHKDQAPPQLPELSNLPRVTVQLPIFNEMYVADRLIDAVCELDYPMDRDGNLIDPTSIGMPAEFPRDVATVVTLTPRDGRTEMTITEHTTTSQALMDGSQQGLEMCIDQMAATFRASGR